MLPVDATPEVRIWRGGAGTGKTEALAARAAGLVEGGADPAGVLVLCAAPWAVPTMRRRLATAGATCAVRVACVRDLELELLDCPEGRAFVGRSLRVADRREEDGLLGVVRGKPGKRERRQREMVRFFGRSWSELAGDDGASWLLPGEEEEIHALVCERLRAIDAVLPCEVGALAVRHLRDDAAALQWAQVDHVLVDDFQALCRASQVLCSMLAVESLAVAADPQDFERAFEDYPYAAGLDELAAANPHAHAIELATCHLAAAPARVLAAVRGELGLPAAPEAPDAAEGSVREETFDRPEDELRGVVGIVRAVLADGMDPADVCVACFHRSWRTPLEQALAGTGVEVADAAQMTGRAPRLLVVCGFVDGFTVPARFFDASQLVDGQKDALWQRRMRALYRLFGKAGERLVVTRFLRIPPEEAQPLGLHVGRIRMVDGARTCLMDEGVALPLVRAGVAAQR